MPRIRRSRGSQAPASTSPPSDTDQFTVLLGLERTEPLTREDRADIDVLVAAAERGFHLAVRCTRCNQWLVAKSSVHAHMGPVCRSKVVSANE